MYIVNIVSYCFHSGLYSHYNHLHLPKLGGQFRFLWKECFFLGCNITYISYGEFRVHLGTINSSDFTSLSVFLWSVYLLYSLVPNIKTRIFFHLKFDFSFTLYCFLWRLTIFYGINYYFCFLCLRTPTFSISFVKVQKSHIYKNNKNK